MKNIHLLPTDKPSNLSLMHNKSQGLMILKTASLLDGIPHHIYITSDEEIKEGDWVYCLREGFEPVLKQKVNPIGVNNDNVFKKIILTTDQYLINDGVQAIDDEFLEWFVENPSCETVKVEREKSIGYTEDRVRVFYGKLKIIIPQEEPKQETLEEAAKDYSLESAQKFAVGKFTKETNPTKGFVHWEDILEVLKVGVLTGHTFGAKFQAERMISKEAYEDSLIMQRCSNRGYESKIYELEQKIERMYSEEEVLELLPKFAAYTLINADEDSRLSLNEWFEQFKKK
jgi:hypothetical protein